jgi:hypothetical protein
VLTRKPSPKGSACGCPGHIRAAFANLTHAVCAEAAGRLKAGLQRLVDGGPAVLGLHVGAPAAAAAAAAAAARRGGKSGNRAGA